MKTCDVQTPSVSGVFVTFGLLQRNNEGIILCNCKKIGDTVLFCHIT